MHISLIFSLVRTAFLSSIFLLIFFLVRTAFIKHTKFEKHKAFKKYISKELMPVAWNPNR